MKRCFDYRVIKRALGYNPPITREIIYLEDDGNIWSFECVDKVYRIHASMTTKKGRLAIESAKSAFKWFFDNTNERRVIAKILKTNRPACVIARACMRFTHADQNHHFYEVANV